MGQQFCKFLSWPGFNIVTLPKQDAVLTIVPRLLDGEKSALYGQGCAFIDSIACIQVGVGDSGK